MKMWKLAALLVLAACASNRPVTVATVDPVRTAPVVAQPPKPMDITGTYEYTTAVNGSTVNGQIVITGTAGAYGGRITSNAFPEFPITKATVDGKVITIKASSDNGDVDLVLTMNGDAFTGKWVLGESGGELSGKKLTKT